MKISNFHMAWLMGSLLFAPACETGTDEVGLDDEADESTGTQTDSDTSTDTSTDADTSTESDTTESDTTESDTTETDTETDGGTGAFECECILDQAEDDPPDPPTCGDVLCDTPLLTNDPENPDSGILIVSNPEAVDCALMALRDRTPGLVTWEREDMTWFEEDWGYVLIYDGGVEAVHRNWYVHDLDYFASPALRFELLEPAHYDACLADPDPLVRYDCLIAPPQVELQTCDEGWYHSG